MATRPDAARGKTTRKGKIKKILKNVIERQSKIKDPDMGMSPGALGGRTKVTLRKPPPPVFRPDRSPPNRRSFGDDLENMRGKADKIAETIIGTFPMVGSKPMRRAFGKKNLKDEMFDGGEVMDLTTEVEVE